MGASPYMGGYYPQTGERHCESKVCCLRTQRNVSDQGSNQDRPILCLTHLPFGHRAYRKSEKRGDLFSFAQFISLDLGLTSYVISIFLARGMRSSSLAWEELVAP